MLQSLAATRLRASKYTDPPYISLDDEDEEELDFETESSDDEEKVEAVATPGSSSSKRKAFNFIPKSSTPSKIKNIHYMSSPYSFLLKIYQTPTKTKSKSTAKDAREKAAQKGWGCIYNLTPERLVARDLVGTCLAKV